MLEPACVIVSIGRYFRNAVVNKGVAYALVSALLFGVSTPLSKVLVGAVPPLMLAGLLYAGSGMGLTVVMVIRHLLARERVALSLPTDREWFWLAGAIFFGGVVGPVLLMYALTVTPASTASLMLNLEVVFTGLLAWFLFRENFDRRIALGLLAIVGGGVLLSWQPDGSVELPIGALLIAAACLCWGVDNNLTRRVSASDATTIAALKGLVAGGVNLGLAASLGYALPAIQNLAAAAVLGFVGYGVSFTLFVLALRHLGTARTSAYFSVAPFFGAAMAILMHTDVVTWQVVAAGVLMAAGVRLHITEHHEHRHAHARQTHSHEHTHDEHHRHEHAGPWDGVEPHAHTHTHEPLAHTHPHYPDVHHRHEH